MRNVYYDEIMLRESDYSPGPENPEAFSFTASPEEEKTESHLEGKFGPEDHIRETLQTCPEEHIRLLGSIQEIVPGIPDHTNVVEVAELNVSPAAPSQPPTNDIEQYVIEHDGERFLSVFKPLDGENKARKTAVGIKRYYPREAAAYEISHAFTFNLAPPTVARTINNREGALQLFVDHNDYALCATCIDQLNMDPEPSPELENSRDFRNMALFDFILANTDRHNNNWMIKTRTAESGEREVDMDEQTGVSLVGIDHGEALNSYNYRIDKVEGPSRALTEADPEPGATGDEIDRGTPRSVPLNAEELVLLEQAVANKQELSDKLVALGIDPLEIVHMWQRAHSLLEEKVFLSKRNRYQLHLAPATSRAILLDHLDYFREHPTDDAHENSLSITENGYYQIKTMSEQKFQSIVNAHREELQKHPMFRDIDRTAIRLIKSQQHPALRAEVR